jgi:hypothetical protein
MSAIIERYYIQGVLFCERRHRTAGRLSLQVCSTRTVYSWSFHGIALHTRRCIMKHIQKRIQFCVSGIFVMRLYVHKETYPIVI